MYYTTFMVALKYKIILNPIAGQGFAGQRIPEINSLLRFHGIDYELFLTTRVWHAAELARDASCEGFDVVISAGGDGTVNEVINGLMLAQERGDKVPVLGCLSIGRGNDFSYGSDIPSDLVSCIEVIVRNHIRPIDVGKVIGGNYPQGRYFGNGIGIGFDTIVGLEAAKMKYFHGFMAYVFGALRTFILYPKAPEMKIFCDYGIIEQSSHQLSIMNGKRMGGVFFMAPNANNHDGLFDLCLAKRINRLEMLILIAHYLKGTQATSSLIKIERSRKYEITAVKGSLVVHADGETICTNGTSLLVECFPSTLQIICEADNV